MVAAAAWVAVIGDTFFVLKTHFRRHAIERPVPSQNRV